jgi:fatty-acyl-CoA synthase
MLPEDFIRRPAGWMAACSEYGATITAGPSFALELAARLLDGRGHIDLSRLRTLITGAETVRASTLRRLAKAGRPHGLDERAFCPAYGLAEATLAVSLVRPGEMWHAQPVDAARLHDGHWVQSDEAGTELVSTGRPLPGVEVRAAGDDDVGEVLVRSPSKLDGYVGDHDDPVVDGWLRTGDLGAVRDGELYLVARLDDMIVVGGRNLYATELETAIAAHPGIRAGSCVAIPDDGGRYVIVAEPAMPDARALGDVAAEIRSLLAKQFTAPSAVHFVARGSLPKTPSGKPQRHRVSHGLQTGTLSVEVTADFSVRP